MKVKSWRVIALLRFIDTHDVHTHHLRKCDNRYLNPLLRDRLIERQGTRIVATGEGHDYLSGYGSAKMTKRKVEGPLSQTATDLLRISNLTVMKQLKSA